ncbi:MAG TPA: hypothetical protein VND96_07325 [Candidatus Micrarchaeaceae archaeon]|nr:hypothetical protein [Candidatus Micrarchaeaceae archaeon]
MDPLRLVEAIGDRTGHVHGKDIALNLERLALNGVLDNRWPTPAAEVPWNFATVGRGHGKAWWAVFIECLRSQGFNGTISVEYADPFVGIEESVLKSACLRSALQARPPRG